MFNLAGIQWLWVIIAAFLVGFSKTGISGFTLLVIPILADVFGGKESTGIILPMLIVGDMFAVWYYHRHTEWSNIKKLLLWVLIGLAMGSTVGKLINDSQFKILIAIMIFICLIILVYIEKKGDSLKVPKKLWFYALTGILVGFSSMLGNAAGPIFTIYLLAMDFKKNEFMGTTAWFFFLINLTKVPLQVFIWHNITMKSILLASGMIPGITLGALLGAVIIKRINEKFFRYLVIGITAIVSFKLFI
jgi:uncharacterized protein